MIALGESTFGSVDVLVNNAGIQFVSPIEEFPVDKWDAIIAINLSSAFHGIRAAVPGMKKRGWAASSTPHRRIRWWPRRSSRPMSRPSMASPASPRPWRWSLPLQDHLQLHQPGYVWTPLSKSRFRHHEGRKPHQGAGDP